MVNVRGLEFAEVFGRADSFNHEGLQVRVIALADLVQAKKASNRAKDQDDIDNLTKAPE